MSQEIGTSTFDNLLAGEIEAGEGATILSGVGIVVRGTVLGKITKGAVATAADGAGTAGANTGAGTITPDATTPILAGSLPGAYSVKFTAATTANVFDPLGRLIGVATVGATFSKQIKFALANSGTAHIAGDGWLVTVSAGTNGGKLKPVNSANADGSEAPYAVLLEGVDATSAAQAAPVALAGSFNAAALVFGGSDTIATHRAALRDLGIYTPSTVAAVNA